MEELNTGFQQLHIEEDQEMNTVISSAERAEAMDCTEPAETRELMQINQKSDLELLEAANGGGVFLEAFRQAWQGLSFERQLEIQAIANQWLPASLNAPFATTPDFTEKMAVRKQNFSERDVAFQESGYGKALHTPKPPPLEKFVVGCASVGEEEGHQVKATMLSQLCKEFDCVHVTLYDDDDVMQKVDDSAPGA